MSKNISIFFAIVVFTLCPLSVSCGVAADSNTQSSLNSQEVREDYHAFLQQLKQLNSQYKQITGEISKTMKEEGVPTWEEGEGMKQIDELFPQEPTVLNPQMGVTIKENSQEMAVDMELPGIKKDSIKVVIKNSKTLTVTAQKKDDTTLKTVQKTVELPSFADPSGAKASYEDGILTLKIRKISSPEVQIPVR